jgi:hypothetical protein
MTVAATDLTTNSGSEVKYVSRKEKEENKWSPTPAVPATTPLIQVPIFVR